MRARYTTHERNGYASAACRFLFGAWISVLGGAVAADETVVLASDDLATRERFVDNSLCALWGGREKPESALEVVAKTDTEGLTFRAVKMKDAAAPHSLWTNDLRCATCFDYEFPCVDRSQVTIRVEFDAFWEELESGRGGQWGEGNRLAVILIHDYPAGGAKFGDLEKRGEGHPFGQPAYSIRIRNTRGGLGAMMSYGGGPEDASGRFETYRDARGIWWLPGFVSSPAKGQSPGDEVSYEGRKDPYPKTPTMKTLGHIASDKQWRHVTWVIQPERMELYQRASREDPPKDRLVFFMAIPRVPADSALLDGLRETIGKAHGLEGANALKQLPPLYNWFGKVNAVRFYFRGNKTYAANLRIVVERS